MKRLSVPNTVDINPKCNAEEIHSIKAGIQSRELCQAPICASAFIPLTGVVGESFSFSTLQMQRRLRPDLNARLEATYRHSHLLSRLNERRHRSRHPKHS